MSVRVPKKNVMNDPEHDPTGAFFPVDVNAKLSPDTICHHIRQIYLIAKSRGDAETMALADICNDMAKRMNNRLIYYYRLMD
jgi:hypothetical protein